MRIAIVIIAIMISMAPRPTNTPIKIAVVFAPLGEPEEENAPEGMVSECSDVDEGRRWTHRFVGSFIHVVSGNTICGFYFRLEPCIAMA